jgi:hypothetical protein
MAHQKNGELTQCAAFGLTHNPRPEDFPVMPVELLSIGIKPSGFFTKNRKSSITVHLLIGFSLTIPAQLPWTSLHQRRASTSLSLSPTELRLLSYAVEAMGLMECMRATEQMVPAEVGRHLRNDPALVSI